MARNHARLLTSIWNDDDFLELEQGPQRLFMLLLSQQNLSHAGLLPLTTKRWANKSKNTTVDQIEEYLQALEDARFIVVSERTEELLIRSFMRRDEVWKQLNVTKAACKDAKAIAAPRLREWLAYEVDRMRAIDGLPDAVQRELTSLAEALPNPTGSPPEPLATGAATPEGRGSVTEVSTDSPSPTPSPAPATVPALRAEPPDDPTGSLLIEHADAYTTPPPPSALVPVRREISRLVAEGVHPDRIRAGLGRLREKQLAASLLPQLVTECGPKPSTTDQRVRGTLALAAEYDAQEHR